MDRVRMQSETVFRDGQSEPVYAALRAAAERRPWLVRPASLEQIPRKVNLRHWLPEVVNQSNRPLCTAAVIAGLAGYLQRRVHHQQRTASLLFNYRTSRRFSGNPDRHGSLLRHAVQAWRSYGLVEEHTWPFAVEIVDTDPTPWHFEQALGWRESCCVRLDKDLTPISYLNVLKYALALGLPVSIEFPLHPSLMRSFETGVVPLPAVNEVLVGRHVVLLCGYDDDLPVPHEERPGALLMQNSWGTRWGERGYGWLPYEFVSRGLTKDSWTALASTAP